MFKAQYCLSFLGVTSNNRCPDSVCDVRLATAPAPSRAWAFCTWTGATPCMLSLRPHQRLYAEFWFNGAGA